MKRNITDEERDAIEVLAPYCRESGTILPDDIWFSPIAKERWEIKATQAVQQYSHKPERTSRSYVNGEHQVTGAVLRDCLLGDEGLELFDIIERRHGPCAWWREIRRLAAIGLECERIIYRNQGVNHGRHDSRSP